MAAFFSAPMLTFVVFAGVAAVGWIRSRPNPLTGSSHSKKEDDEVNSSTSIEVVVDDTAKQQHAPQDKHKLDAAGRRQYAKPASGRFEQGTNNEEIAPNLPAQFEAFKTAAASALRNNANSARLSSFVRQCVSNIERANSSLGGLPTRSLSPRASLLSNQSDSPPKSKALGRLPSLVTATDCEPNAPADRMDSKPSFNRVPSTLASKPPMLAPFMASKPSPSWEQPRESNKTTHVNPEADSDAGPETQPVVTRKSEPQLVRKGSASERLQQFQQLVPSNQARYSQVQ